MEEKILYQFIMNYKAYRRGAVIVRSLVALSVAGGALGLCAVSVPLGIVIAVAVVALGGISVILAFGVERTYTVYNTRIVIKTKNKRRSIPTTAIRSVKFTRAFYERDLATGTLTVVAKDDKGRAGRFKLKHIFDAREAVDHLKRTAEENARALENRREGIREEA